MPKYERKTADEWRVFQHCNGTWEEVSAAESWKDARQTVREYQDNQPGIPVKYTGPHRVKLT